MSRNLTRYGVSELVLRLLLPQDPFVARGQLKSWAVTDKAAEYIECTALRFRPLDGSPQHSLKAASCSGIPQGAKAD